MIIDARLLPNGTKIETEVCIVGSGTAGTTLAREFKDQRFRVSLLESGGLRPDQETQSLSWGENVGHPYFPLDTAYSRYLGGTTNRWMLHVGGNHFGARMRPLDPIDFEERNWVPHSGWPFERSHLDAYYERAQKICRISPPSFETEDWEDPGRTPQLSLPGGKVKTVIFKFGLRDPFLKEYLPEILQAPNIHTYVYGNVTEIETDETGRNVACLRAASLSGKKFSISAKTYILATGGIETPRLLLLSRKHQTPGLGNGYDLVGRFFMEHPHCWSGILIPSSPKLFGSTALYNHVHRVNGVAILGKLCLSGATLRRERLLNYVAELVPRVARRHLICNLLYPSVGSESVRSFKAIRSAIRSRAVPADFGNHLRNIFSEADEIGLAAYRKVRRRNLEVFGRGKVKLFRLANMSEQAPNPLSRVTLSLERDRHGVNRAQLDWRLSPMDTRSIIRSQEILAEGLYRSGLGRLHIEMNDRTPPEVITGGWHQMGTTRMHRDPKKGVVDEHGKVHGISNLYVAGPSVFPTSGYANPVLTIVALSVRLADRVKALFACKGSSGSLG